MVFEGYGSDFASFTDNTTFYECGPTFNEIMNNLETNTKNCLNGSVSISIEWMLIMP